VEDVVVDEAYSGMGIGSLLLEHIEKYAKSEGVSRLQLMVYQQNESAIAFYKKHGWTETDYVGFRKYI
jgi:ribosomal protein S18 acetylase RimI-like enzyme